MKGDMVNLFQISEVTDEKDLDHCSFCEGIHIHKGDEDCSVRVSTYRGTRAAR